MIAQYQILCSSEQARLAPSVAYKLYSWLLESLPEDIGDQLHNEQYNPFSQYLYYDRDSKQNVWVINVLDSRITGSVAELLEKTKSATIDEGEISLKITAQKAVNNVSELVEQAKASTEDTTFSKLSLPVPTSFKVAGRYSIFPTGKLILQSLVNRWNTCFTDYVLDDEDAFFMLEQNLHIVDYNLRSTRFFLKGTKIPGFMGDLVMHARLPAPMMEIWKLLLLFAPYSGIGIKTTLGMGGVKIR